MNARLLHVSDLHAGTHEEPEVEQALARLVERIEPQLVVASGDLAHRGRREQLERAAALLRSLGPPVLAVPGNHDLPYTPARFVRPWTEFERVWETTEPTVVAAGPPRRRAQLGAAVPPSGRRARAGRSSSSARERLGAAERRRAARRRPPPPSRSARRGGRRASGPSRGATTSSTRSSDAGADLILAGHIHQAAVSERHEFEVVGDEARTAVIAIAPGLGQPRPRRLGEARGLHVHEADAEAIVVRTYRWSRGDWTLGAERRFLR